MTTQTRKEVISGDLIQVVNADTDEHLGATTEDIEIEIDEDTTDQELSTQRRRIRRRSYNEANVSVEALIASDLASLEETGIVEGEDGKVVFDEDARTWDEGALLRVFDGIDNVAEAASADADQIVKCEMVEWQTEGIDYSDDFATVSLVGMVHQDIYLDWTEETT